MPEFHVLDAGNIMNILGRALLGCRHGSCHGNGSDNTSELLGGSKTPLEQQPPSHMEPSFPQTSFSTFVKLYYTRENLLCLFGGHLWEIGSQNKTLQQPVIWVHGSTEAERVQIKGYIRSEIILQNLKFVNTI